jgi:two-component system NtrC family response regulator
MNEAKTAAEVLVVDDSPVPQKLVERVVSSERYSLTLARDGAGALRLFEERSPSIVITDLPPTVRESSCVNAFVRMPHDPTHR